MRTLLTALACAVLCGCAGAKSTLYDPGAVQAVTSWSVGFRYETGSVEESMSETAGSATTVIREGNTPRNLLLRDDIVVYLDESYGIRAFDAKCDSCGHISLHPISDGWGFTTVDAVLSNSSGEVLARTKIKNGTRNATHKGDDDFAKFVAQKLADLIK